MIYFIQETGNTEAPIKIGYTSNSANKRVGELQTAHHKELAVLACVDGSREDEKREHKRWGQLRIRGEWFRATEELNDYVRGLILSGASAEKTKCTDDNSKWREIVRLEPRLLGLLRDVQGIKDLGGETFCANIAWCSDKYRFKDRLERLVGWCAAGQELKTEEAYDVAYEMIYSVLPACRNCWCF